MGMQRDFTMHSEWRSPCSCSVVTNCTNVVGFKARSVSVSRRMLRSSFEFVEQGARNERSASTLSSNHGGLEGAWVVSEQTKTKNICSALSYGGIGKRCCASVTKTEIPGQVFRKLTATPATNLAGADLTNPWGFFLAGVGFPDLGTDQGLRIRGKHAARDLVLIQANGTSLLDVTTCDSIIDERPKGYRYVPQTGAIPYVKTTGRGPAHPLPILQTSFVPSKNLYKIKQPWISTNMNENNAWV